MVINTQHFKEKLEKELSELETELKSVGQKNPESPSDWEAKKADIDADAADDMEVADSIEEYETNTAILKQLEIRYNEVKNALSRIENNSYGKCKISGEEIEEERLEANPAAETCIEHMEE